MAQGNSGMASFAMRNMQTDAGRADSPGGNPTLDDLKLPNTSAARTKKKSLGRSKSRSQQQQGNSHLFEDTDASEADRTSTTTSVRRSSHANGQHSQHKQLANGQQRGDNAQPNYVFDQRQYLPDNSRAEDAEQMYKRELAEAEAAQQAQDAQPGKVQPVIITDRYTKGDSYPPTTSGTPSVSEQRGRSDSESSHGEKAVHTAQKSQFISGLSRGPSQRGPLNRVTLRPGVEPGYVQQQAPATAHDDRSKTGRSSRLSPPALEGFSFEPFGPKHTAPVQQPAPAQQRANHDPSKDRSAPHAPVRNDGLPQGRHPVYRSPQESQASDMTTRQTTAVTSHYHRNVKPSPIEQPVQGMADGTTATHYQQDPQSEDYGSEIEQSEMGYDDNEDNKPDMQNVDDRPDHDPEELFAMDYKVLRAESMEEAPNAEPYFIQGLADSAPISDKLAAVREITSAKDPRKGYNDQAKFFASLTIDEWEDAGDWFLGRFGEVMNKLRSFRREKRKAAKAFEDEIEGRDFAVAAKRKFTEHALEEMRQNGQHVLQGTPKKGGRSR